MRGCVGLTAGGLGVGVGITLTGVVGLGITAGGVGVGFMGGVGIGFMPVGVGVMDVGIGPTAPIGFMPVDVGLKGAGIGLALPEVGLTVGGCPPPEPKDANFSGCDNKSIDFDAHFADFGAKLKLF